MAEVSSIPRRAPNHSSGSGAADTQLPPASTHPSDYTALFASGGHGGFDPDVFVAKPVDEQYICPVCKNVLREPTLVVSCGHHFCLSCITAALKVKEQCPLDRGALSIKDAGKLVPNLDLKRRVGQLEVNCESRIHGCPWRGPLINYDGHLSSKSCRVVCVNGCSDVMPRSDMEQHLQICTHTWMKCPYQFVGDGCTHECYRKDLQEHLKESQIEHSLMTVKSVDMLTQRLWQVAGLKDVDRQSSHTFVFDKFASRVQHKRPFYSDAFYIGPCESGYRLRMKIDPDDSPSGISFYYALVKGKNDDRLEWPFRRTVVVQCLHSVEDRIIVEQTVRPPNEDEKSKKYTCRPTEVNNRRGWGRKGILSREKQAEAGAIVHDQLRVRYIVPWEEPTGYGGNPTQS